MPAIVEEILVRGFLYSGLLKKLSVVSAALIASGIFALAHLQFLSGQPLVFIAAIDTFVLSLALIWLRQKTGNIWPGVVVHMLKNSLAFVSIFILKIT
jgi:membrane protease YdiL (CAAX protease family)